MTLLVDVADYLALVIQHVQPGQVQTMYELGRGLDLGLRRDALDVLV